MADRYWVGGTATWNGTAGTKWALTSGGPGGETAPTSADDVFFDGASGTVTVTIDPNRTAKSVNCTGFTGTLTGTGDLTVSGNITFVATMTWSFSGATTVDGTSVITSAGKTWTGTFTVQGTGITVTLGDAFTSNTSINVLRGTFTTANYNVTATQISSSNANVRTINLGSSTVTLTANGIAWQTGNTSNLTLNAGTSTIICSGSGPTFDIASGALTFYNVSFTNTDNLPLSLPQSINGTTFNNITVTAPAAIGSKPVNIPGRTTINGTLSTTGTAGNKRVWFRGGTAGIAHTLTINSAPSLTDADFRDIYVVGTAAPISGTRIGNRGGCRGITFSAPKTVYRNLAGTQDWSANGWTDTPTGTPSTDFFPLPQDTATFTNSGAATGPTTLDAAIGYVPNVDMSGRTSAMTLNVSTNTTVYGNWTNGSGTSLGSSGGLTFSGGGTQTITSAGKTFPGAITIDTYGGTVQLADAINMGISSLTITNGTFDTKNYNVTTGSLSSSNSNVRTINLGSSTVTIAISIVCGTTNLTFNANTSTITAGNNFNTFTGDGLTFYNFTFSASPAATVVLPASITFNNLTLTAGAASSITSLPLSGNVVVTGTLNVAGASPIRRNFIRSNTIGTSRTITAAAISATDCDFRDITIAGAAAGSSPTRAGDCGNNSGITFPVAKTVYWNLAGAQNWSATAWCTGSGGTPNINNFPLAQDTAVFDEAASSVTGTITIDASWNIGTFDASARTSAMTLTTSTNTPVVYGNWKFGTGVTSSSTTGTITFAKNGTQTITSNGIQFGCPVIINNLSGTVQLADDISLGATRTLTLTSGTFDAVTYNVTVGLFQNSATTNILKMGSGTWTLSGVGSVWNLTNAPILVVGSSTIVLSNTSTSSRNFIGGSYYYNKLTIGGTTGTSTLTIFGTNGFGELASTKTVAHTIVFPSSVTTTVGKWSVTGTSGNVVTISPSVAVTAYTLYIAGPATSGIDYLSISYCTLDASSLGEFYAGANSTNTAGNTRVIFTATPAARTLYWVGGTGNWSATTSWSLSSNGSSGEAIPTSLDAVIFDSGSNATAYTATIDAGVTTARCASFTMAGPASGNVTFAGSVAIAMHGNVSFAATGITRTYSAQFVLAGNSTYTFTTNGLTLANALRCAGVGATWSQGSAIDLGTSSIVLLYGTYKTANYALTFGGLVGAGSLSGYAKRGLDLGSSTLTINTGSFGLSSSSLDLRETGSITFNAGTSTITSTHNNAENFDAAGFTIYNASWTGTQKSAFGFTISGNTTFNNLTISGRNIAGLSPIYVYGSVTVNGTFTVSAGSSASCRVFVISDTVGTTRTITCAAVSLTDVDFRDITIAGAAAPASGTRLGDCKGNSGITFPGAKTVYYRGTGSSNWGDTTSWSATNGGGSDSTQFPLAQDTAIFPAATYPASGSTITVNANYNIGTIDMSLRTTNTMTLATGSTSSIIYGNWINGTGTTLTGTGTITFAGRGTQTVTSAGKAFTQTIAVTSLGGTVICQDAFSCNKDATAAFSLTSGTFDANGYNVIFSAASSQVVTSGSLARTLAFGSGTWTLAGSNWNFATSTNLTVTGTGIISLTNPSSKTFAGGGISYSGITLNQGGAGVITITGNNTFKNITNSYSATAATSIDIGTTTQTVTQWTGTGAVGKLFTVRGSSAVSPGTLIFSGAGAVNVDYLVILGVRAYSLSSTWYAGTNSTNSGSLGWIFAAAPSLSNTGNFFLFF